MSTRQFYKTLIKIKENNNLTTEPYTLLKQAYRGKAANNVDTNSGYDKIKDEVHKNPEIAKAFASTALIPSQSDLFSLRDQREQDLFEVWNPLHEAVSELFSHDQSIKANKNFAALASLITIIKKAENANQDESVKELERFIDISTLRSRSFITNFLQQSNIARTRLIELMSQEYPANFSPGDIKKYKRNITKAINLLTQHKQGTETLLKHVRDGKPLSKAAIRQIIGQQTSLWNTLKRFFKFKLGHAPKQFNTLLTTKELGQLQERLEILEDPNLKKAQNDLDDLKRKINNKQNELSAINDEINTKNNEKTIIEAEIATKSTEKALIVAEIELKNTVKAEIESDIDSKKGEQIKLVRIVTELHSKKAKLDSEIQRCQGEFNEINKQHSAAQAKLDELLGTLEAKQQALSSAREELSKFETEKLIQKAEVSELEENKATLNSEIDSLQQKLAQTKEKLNNLLTEINNANIVYVNLQKAQDELTKIEADLTSKNEEFKQLNDATQAQLETHKKKLEEIKFEINIGTEALAVLKNQLNEHTMNSLNLKAQIEIAEKKVSELDEAIAKNTETVAQQESVVEDQQQIIETKKRVLEDLDKMHEEQTSILEEKQRLTEAADSLRKAVMEEVEMYHGILAEIPIFKKLKALESVSVENRSNQNFSSIETMLNQDDSCPTTPQGLNYGDLGCTTPSNGPSPQNLLHRKGATPIRNELQRLGHNNIFAFQEYMRDPVRFKILTRPGGAWAVSPRTLAREQAQDSPTGSNSLGSNSLASFSLGASAVPSTLGRSNSLGSISAAGSIQSNTMQNSLFSPGSSAKLGTVSDAGNSLGQASVAQSLTASTAMDNSLMSSLGRKNSLMSSAVAENSLGKSVTGENSLAGSAMGMNSIDEAAHQSDNNSLAQSLEATNSMSRDVIDDVNSLNGSPKEMASPAAASPTAGPSSLNTSPLPSTSPEKSMTMAKADSSTGRDGSKDEGKTWSGNNSSSFNGSISSTSSSTFSYSSTPTTFNQPGKREPVSSPVIMGSLDDDNSMNNSLN